MNKPTGEAFKYCFALFKSISDVISDSELSLVKKQEMLNENLCDFNECIAKEFGDWSDDENVAKSFELNEETQTALKKSKEIIEELLKSVDDSTKDDDDYTDDDESDDVNKKDGKKESCKKSNEEEFDMAMIDVAKMSPEDKAVLEELKKKYAGEDEGVEKSAEVHPEVQKALDEVAEIKKSLELEKMTAIAKKYEVLGKKADETAEMLYNLKNSNEEAYNSVVKAYDEMVDTVEKSDIFKEFGSNREGSGSDLEGIVTDLRKSAPEMSYEQAVIKAFEINPNLDPMTGKLR